MLKPIFVYDGDCPLCRFWVARWKKRVGEDVVFAPFQTEAILHPDIPEEEFRRSSQLLLPDGARYSGAAGVFRTLSFSKNIGIPWMWMYAHLPGFRSLSERLYLLVSSCRICSWKFTQMLFPSAKKFEK